MAIYRSLAECLVLASVVAAAASARAAIQCGSPAADGARLCSIPASIDSLANCNDGTRPVFWVRPGQGAGANRWVIWLEGGGQCIDQPSCSARAANSPGFLTSTGYSGRSGAGILASDAGTNPVLFNANTVLVHYCSSDEWSGAYSSARHFVGSDPTTWNFEGRRIALAAITALRELNLGFPNAQQILLGGSSAGGLGITVTANDLIPALPETHDVRVVNDAGYALDIGQFDPSRAAPYVYPGRPNAFYALFQSGMTLWHGRGDAKCDAAARTEQARVDCYSTLVYQHGYINVTALVSESQLDVVQLSDELCPLQYGACPVPTDPLSQQGQYATAFAGQMAQALIGPGGAGYSVFAPDAYMHTIMTNAAVFTTKYAFPGARLSAQAVLGQWLRTGGIPRIVDIGSGPGVAVARSHARPAAPPDDMGIGLSNR